MDGKKKLEELVADEVAGIADVDFDGVILNCHEIAEAVLAIARPAIRKEVLEEARAAYEAHDKTGREWVAGSLWDTLNREAAARIRSLYTTGQEGGR